jgi:hypothetical protein
LADIKSPTKELLLNDDSDKERLIPGTWQPARIIPDEGGEYYQSRDGVVVAIKNHKGSWTQIHDGRSDEELAKCDICRRAVATQQTQLALARVAPPVLIECFLGRAREWSIDALKVADGIPASEFATGAYLITKRRIQHTSDGYKLIYIRAGTHNVSFRSWRHNNDMEDMEVLGKHFEEMGFVYKPELEAQLEADGFWERAAG